MYPADKMAKLNIILLLSSFFMIMSFLLPLAYSETKVTNVRVYFQDAFNTSQPIAYGDVFAFQGALTVGPDPNSTHLGRAQGTLAITAYDASFDLHVSQAYIFTSGRYNGSTVVAVGRNNATESVRQFPIVGGTGHFKLARGIVTATTYSSDPLIYIYDLEIFQDYYNSEIEMKYV